MSFTSDIAIVGAGPVGLLTAIELRLQGLHPVVLERLPAPSLAAKAMGIGPLGAEALQRRGMADAIDAAEARVFAAMQALLPQPGAAARGPGSKFSGHFAGLSLIRKDAQREPERRARPVDQPAIEAMLAERVAALGVDVRRGWEVTDFAEQPDGLELACTTPSGPARLRCAWLVACDGGRSGLRKRAGFEFPGTPPSSTFYQASAEIDHPERLLPVGWHRTGGGVFSYGPFPGRLVMLDFSGTPENRDAPVTRDEIEEVLRRVSGRDVRVKSLAAASRWTDNTRLADTYRRGRVLLAGDAAHVNNPIGGMGLNGGIQDAANLAEKLAAVLLAGAPERLLDLYNLQRRTVATEFVQEQSIANKKRLEARDPETRRRNLDELREMSADPARARQFLLRTSMIASQQRVAAMTLAEA
jgi:2-polyprenyl-6-methoxyphenol hydroxylase-like FAD-dependent oxidoreductase